MRDFNSDFHDIFERLHDKEDDDGGGNSGARFDSSKDGLESRMRMPDGFGTGADFIRRAGFGMDFSTPGPFNDRDVFPGTGMGRNRGDVEPQILPRYTSDLGPSGAQCFWAFIFVCLGFVMLIGLLINSIELCFFAFVFMGIIVGAYANGAKDKEPGKEDDYYG